MFACTTIKDKTSRALGQEQINNNNNNNKTHLVHSHWGYGWERIGEIPNLCQYMHNTWPK